MSERQFSKSHEWITFEAETATIGISDFAQKELGDIVYLELPEIGAVLTAGSPFADIESVKAASQLYAPVSGTVTAVNESLTDAPEQLNNEPDETWIIEVKEVAITGDALMSAAEYAAFIETQA